MYKPFDKHPEPDREDHGVGVMFWFSASFLVVAFALIAMRYFG